ncbi:MAG: hypothetical protein WEB04_11930 [Dehalococcoidia bacterium]
MVTAITPRGLRKVLVVLAGLSFALALTACGGGDDTPAVTPTVEGEATPTEESAAADDTVQIDQSYWHAGFKVSLSEATLTDGDVGSPTVTIDATFENLGNTDATPDSQLALTSGANSYSSGSLEEDIPRVPAGLSSTGTIAFDVDEDFTFDDATLIVGNPQNNQAFVPLGPDGDELVSLLPREIPATGTVAAGAVTAHVTGAELRADLPNQHSEMEAGKLALTVRFDIDVGSGIQIGQGVFQGPNVALILPDGTAVAVRSDGVSGVNELLQGKEGTTISDLAVRFEVDEPSEGTYAFVVRGAYGPGGTDVEGQVTIQIPPATTGGAAANATP